MPGVPSVHGQRDYRRRDQQLLLLVVDEPAKPQAHPCRGGAWNRRQEHHLCVTNHGERDDCAKLIYEQRHLSSHLPNLEKPFVGLLIHTRKINKLNDIYFQFHTLIVFSWNKKRQWTIIMQTHTHTLKTLKRWSFSLHDFMNYVYRRFFFSIIIIWPCELWITSGSYMWGDFSVRWNRERWCAQVQSVRRSSRG